MGIKCSSCGKVHEDLETALTCCLTDAGGYLVSEVDLTLEASKLTEVKIDSPTKH